MAQIEICDGDLKGRLVVVTEKVVMECWGLMLSRLIEPWIAALPLTCFIKQTLADVVVD